MTNKTKILCLGALSLAFTITSSAYSSDVQQILFPMAQFPHEETVEDVKAREVRLFRHDAEVESSLSKALADGKVGEWVDAFSEQKYNHSYTELPYIVTSLAELAAMAKERNLPALQEALAPRLISGQAAAFEVLNTALKWDVSNGHPEGHLRDLNTVAPARVILEAALALKLLGKYEGETKARTEKFISEYVENQKPYIGVCYINGYNKAVYSMDVPSLVALLYADHPEAFPMSKNAFESFWDGIVHRSYETDNSPHYDACTGFWVILRMAYLHHREEDLKKNPYFHYILTRMALTIANNGQTAKWGKSMEEMDGDELTPDGGGPLSWTLKMGYHLFQDPFLLYTARKYEDLRLFGSNKRWMADHAAIWPSGINAEQVTGVICPPSTPLSTTTTRITSQKDYNGLALGKGDTNFVTVQDKVILTTGRYPLAPYLMMDLSYTEQKASGDHRIGIANVMFGGAHLCTYLGRPGEGSRVSRPFVCPKQFEFPIVDAVSGDVYPSKEYEQRTGYDSRFDYILSSYSATNPSLNYASGMVDYSKFQYTGIHAKREVVMTHNGVVLIMDRIQAGSDYKGNHWAGVSYQLWPSISQEDPNPQKRWVVQSAHKGTSVLKDGPVTNSFSTLFYFPPVGTPTTTAIRIDPKGPAAKKTKVFCAWTDLKKTPSVAILSIIIPLKDPAKASELVAKILVEQKGESYSVRIPCTPEDIQVVFSPDKPAACGER